MSEKKYISLLPDFVEIRYYLSGGIWYLCYSEKFSYVTDKEFLNRILKYIKEGIELTFIYKYHIPNLSISIEEDGIVLRISHKELRVLASALISELIAQSLIDPIETVEVFSMMMNLFTSMTQHLDRKREFNEEIKKKLEEEMKKNVCDN